MERGAERDGGGDWGKGESIRTIIGNKTRVQSLMWMHLDADFPCM